MNGPLDQYRRSKYSQHGEDGILEFLTGKLGVTMGWSMEFGAFDGTTYSNTLALVEQGWRGLYVEPDQRHRDALKKLDRKYRWLKVLYAYIDDMSRHFVQSLDVGDLDTPILTIDEAVGMAGFPLDFEVLSIDTDGNDAAIWRSLKYYRPKIVVIEINSSKIIYMRRMVELGQNKHYTCLGHCGNLIFVRDEDFDALGIAREEVADPDRLYTPNEEDW